MGNVVSRASEQAYALKAEEQFPRQRSGQLSSQGLRVFSLSVVPSANQVSPDAFNALMAVGRRILYDPTGAAFLCGLEIAFERRQNAEYISIYPGCTYAFDDGYQFEKLYLRFQPLFVSSIGGLPAGGVFVGRLIISNGMYASLLGSTPDIALYTRPTPTILSMGQAANGVAGITNNWAVNGGGSSYLTYLFSVPGITAAAYTTGFRTKIKNVGSTPVYVSLSGTLTTPGGLALGQTFVLFPGEEDSWFSSARPNNLQQVGTSAPQPVFVYSGDAAANVCWSVEQVE